MSHDPGSSSLWRPGRWLLIAAVLGLFTAWSLSFISIEALLSARPGRPARFDWLSLTVARFAPAALFSFGYCVTVGREQSRLILRHHLGRLIASAVLIVPCYNFALYSGQQLQIPAPVASILTALAPLFVMGLSRLFLGEAITRQRLAGFAVALVGLGVIATARDDGSAIAYPLRVALVALAPLSWSLHTVLTKPVAGKVSPLVWTYLGIGIGTAPLLLILPWKGGPELLTLDAAGWGWLLHLTVACTILGFALWAWLLQHLPATSVAFTVFLNPPMTTGYKVLLATLAPGVFQFSVVRGELLGGLLLLAGVAIALFRRRKQ